MTRFQVRVERPPRGLSRIRPCHLREQEVLHGSWLLPVDCSLASVNGTVHRPFLMATESGSVAGRKPWPVELLSGAVDAAAPRRSRPPGGSGARALGAARPMSTSGSAPRDAVHRSGPVARQALGSALGFPDQTRSSSCTLTGRRSAASHADPRTGSRCQCRRTTDRGRAIPADAHTPRCRWWASWADPGRDCLTPTCRLGNDEDERPRFQMPTLRLLCVAGTASEPRVGTRWYGHPGTVRLVWSQRVTRRG